MGLWEEGSARGGPAGRSNVGVVGGHINSMLIAAKAAKSSNVMDGRRDRRIEGPTVQHSACRIYESADVHRPAVSR